MFFLFFLLMSSADMSNDNLEHFDSVNIDVLEWTYMNDRLESPVSLM